MKMNLYSMMGFKTKNTLLVLNKTLLSINYHYNYSHNLYNKRACPTKNKPQQGISFLEREKEGVRERGVGRGERERGGREGVRESGGRVNRSADRLI
jgi:hypothetical protein